MAFNCLKAMFTSAPILSHPDPNRQFVVEVDASDVGVEAVLSQQDPAGQKLQPCAFFRQQLSPAEGHYNVGNRELWFLKPLDSTSGGPQCRNECPYSSFQIQKMTVAVDW